MSRITVAAIVSLWVIPISIFVNQVVPEPYMDEIFHIPQAQQYCKGNFRSWDPMITTPPGLYFLSLAHVASLFPAMFFVQGASIYPKICSIAILRSINGAMAVICAILFYDIIIHLRPGLDKREATLCSVVLALYPLHWFFTFLYYTDVASLTMVLAMYLTFLKKKYTFSALFGAFAIFIRQTNIIWVFFVACTGIINGVFIHNLRNEKVDDMAFKENSCLVYNKSISMCSNVRRRKLSNVIYSSNALRVSSSTLRTDLLDELWAIMFSPWSLKMRLLLSLSPFFIVLVTAVAFVIWNGSIVLGAKEAHFVSPHFAQLMYFGLVSALTMAPFHFTANHACSMFQLLWKNKPHSFFIGIFALTTGFVSVHFFSLAHPYLLADNRHYTFYLWRIIFGAHWSRKCSLVPLYIYSWVSIFSLLGRVERKIWVLTYFLATAAALVPAPLIEFRYYTVPFYFLILHTSASCYCNRSWILMGVLYVTVNAITMVIFLFWSFRWEHEPGIQRFIW